MILKSVTPIKSPCTLIYSSLSRPAIFIFIWLRKRKFTYFISYCLSGNGLMWDLRILTQWFQEKGNWGQGKINDSQREMGQGWARAWVPITPLFRILREPGSGSLSRHKPRGAHTAKSAYKSPWRKKTFFFIFFPFLLKKNLWNWGWNGIMCLWLEGCVCVCVVHSCTTHVTRVRRNVRFLEKILIRLELPLKKY